MVAIKLIVIAIVVMAIFMAAMSIRLLFKKNAKFSGGSCSSSPTLDGKGTSCGCGGGSCSTEK
ncbi:hypothetical protein [Williamwhitmania taraxaci]|uniref:Uncharacterized protein n=1 Tax=Williamwhitmania taraxaci TaxID=1640674 RepID=A0A1G6KD87_9BACT|nr:hypothetical protein [Williamwhitmania taraxaci]SDC29052.1 hypothetical protein SAMN05216323_102440 [Williamwhitmania taraxaci]